VRALRCPTMSGSQQYRQHSESTTVSYDVRVSAVDTIQNGGIFHFKSVYQYTYFAAMVTMYLH
jgi:hypothetical protein